MELLIYAEETLSLDTGLKKMCIMIVKLTQYVAYYLEWFFIFQVAAVVFTEDLKRLFVTMKEGFPLEYVVSI